VKRTATRKRDRGVKSDPKLPDELLPIVDSVVEVVFERLRNVMSPGKGAKPQLRRKTARLNLPLPKQRTALAEALADLLLADLASRAGPRRSKASGAAKLHRRRVKPKVGAAKKGAASAPKKLRRLGKRR
jgi:hypothetical protein